MNIGTTVSISAPIAITVTMTPTLVRKSRGLMNRLPTAMVGVETSTETDKCLIFLSGSSTIRVVPHNGKDGQSGRERDDAQIMSRCFTGGCRYGGSADVRARAGVPAEYQQVLSTLGKQGDFKDNVLKVNIPRNDVKVTVAGVKTPTPFGFGGWVAMTKGDGAWR